MILALSLPVTAPWYTAVIGSVAAIGVGKALFGGLGMNLFNPAMVGRAFVMISFAGALGAAGYQDPGSSIDVMTQATPLTAFQQSGVSAGLADLFLGRTNGSLGETSALACLIGGLFLCIRRSAAWRIPAAILLSTFLLSAFFYWLDGSKYPDPFFMLFSGGLMLGAVFMATDMVTAPLTPTGIWLYGFLIGFVTVIIRLFGGLPEGIMYAILLGNVTVPLLEAITQPRIYGSVKK